MMTVKDWLMRAWRIDAEIQSLADSKDELFNRFTSTVGNTDKEAVYGTKDPHKFDSYIILSEQINAQIDKLLAIKSEIFAAIRKIEDTRYRQVLEERYIRMHTLEETAVVMGYSYQQICRLQGEAFQEIKQFIKDETK